MIKNIIFDFDGVLVDSEILVAKAFVKYMLNFDGPYLLEVCVEKEENVFPMIPSGASVSDVRLS